MLNWFTPFYLFAIYGLVCFFIKSKESSDKPVRWTPLEAICVTLGIYFGGQLIGGAVPYLALMLSGASEKRIIDLLENNVYGQFIFILFIEAASLGMLLLFLRLRKATLKTIGLVRRLNWSDLAYAAGGLLVYLLIFILVTGLLKGVIPSLDVDQKQQIGFDNPSQMQLPFVFASLVLLPPIVEELLVRGFLYTGLKNGLPKLWAVFVASALFGVAHLQAGSGETLLWIAGIDTFVLSLVLIYLREKTGSLWASITLHMLKNTIAFASIFIFHLA